MMRSWCSLASVLWLSGTALLAAHQSAPEGRDLPVALRAKTGIDIEQAARPLPEVLKRISAQTAVPLAATRELHPQNVTVLFRRMPFQDAVRSIASAVDGVWREELERGGKMVYTLHPSERRSRRLRWFRQGWKKTEARCVEMVLSVLDARLNPPPGDQERRDPNAPPPSPRTEPEALYPLFRSLPRSVWRRVIAESYDCSWPGGGVAPDKSAQLVLPGRALGPAGRDALRNFLHSVAQEASANPPRGVSGLNAPSENIPDAIREQVRQRVEQYRTLAQQIDEITLHLWTLQSSEGRSLALDLFFQLSKRGDGWRFDGKVAETGGPALPEILEKPGDLLVAGAPATSVLEERKLVLTYGTARSDRALLEIARAAGVNLAADAYTRGQPFPLVARDKPLQSLLADYETLYRGSHCWLGSALVMRSRDWPFRYDREPPAAVLDRWDAALKKPGDHHSCDDYLAAAAGAQDRQIPGIRNHLDEHGESLHRESAYRLGRNRHVLRGWASLNAPQKQAAGGQRGVALASLGAPQQAAWRRALAPYELVLQGADWSALRLRALPPASGDEVIPSFVLLGLPDISPVDLVPGK